MVSANVLRRKPLQKGPRDDVVSVGWEYALDVSLNPENYHDCMYHEANPPTWPTPSGDTPSKIDDLYHAAVNGRGLFFSASNAQELVESLAELTSDIAGRTASTTSVDGNGFASIDVSALKTGLYTVVSGSASARLAVTK